MKIISFTILLAFYLTACSHSHETPAFKESTFIFDLQTGISYYGKTSVNLRSGTTLPASAVLEELYYYIFNEQGKAVPNKDGKICRSYAAIQLAAINNRREEELPEGRYTISFLGLGEKNSNGFNDLQTVTEYLNPWISTETVKQLPMKGEYYFATANIIVPQGVNLPS